MASPTRSANLIGLPTHHAELVDLVAQGRPVEPSIDQVSTSWQRSANQYRVDPDSRASPRILTAREVGERRGPIDELVGSAQPELDRLYKVVREAGYTILFCDNAGVAVEHRGDDADASRFRFWGTWLGGVWSEALEGTNGIGTCIAEERPVTIHRSQHYRTRHVDLSCSGAPVFGADGRLMAVLDVSAIDPDRSERAHALTGALTVASARAIEERFFREQFRKHWVIAIAAPEGGGLVLLAVDTNPVFGRRWDQKLVGEQLQISCASDCERDHTAYYPHCPADEGYLISNRVEFIPLRPNICNETIYFGPEH